MVINWLLVSLSVVGVFAAIGSIVLLWAMSLRRVVPTNMVHIVQSTKKTTPYGRNKPSGNTYYHWPKFLPVIGVEVSEFPESIIQVDLEAYDSYDLSKVPFVVDVAAFFRVDDAGVAAQSVSTFEELHEQLKSILRGAVRRILATNNIEDIMQARAELAYQFTEEVSEQVREWGVKTVKNVEFMDIRDSARGEVIQNIMAKEQSRISRESRVVIAENSRQALLKEIDAKRDVDLQNESAEQQVGLRSAENRKMVGIADQQAEQEIKEQIIITTERDMDVKRVGETRQAEIDREVAAVRAAQEKAVQVIKTEADKESQNLLSQARLYASEQDARGIEIEGKAKAEAERLMLLAPVETQITLAKEIGENEGYQSYLINLEQIGANKEVGIAMSGALKDADLKIIANTGDVSSGVSSLTEVLSPKGGLNIGGMLESLANTPEGKKMLSRLTGSEE